MTYSERIPLFLILIITLCLIPGSAVAQKLSGYVLDASTREFLPGANIYLPKYETGDATDANGQFSILAEEGDSIVVSFVGYETIRTTLRDGMMIYLEPELSMEELIIRGVRASATDPVSQSTLSRSEIREVYNGEQPIFMLENLTPAVFSFSESGTRLANYGSMRLRGMAQERINFTLNGIPLNDMIDHGVFFSNFTDLGNSFESIQVQRGVGTSPNGVASYAGSVNFESINLEQTERGGELSLGAGSFDSYRMNASVASGKINDKWAFYGNYNRILSDGYRNNTFTDAYSFFFSGAYFGEKDLIKINAFEAQSRNGLGYLAEAESALLNDPRTNSLNPNDTDNFGQQLIQLQHIRTFNDEVSLNSSLYYGGASGDYFFSYQGANDLEQINYPLINRHYGLMSTLHIDKSEWSLSTGVHAYLFNRENEESFSPDFENPYYRETSQKQEFSAFARAERAFGDLKVFGDVQLRSLELAIQPDYDFIGIQPEGDINRNWLFVNPKVGVSYQANENLIAYASAGRMGREPTKIDIFGGFNLGAANYTSARNADFEAEYVNDYEAGLKLNYQSLAVSANLFFMDFENEIAPIGEILAFGVQRRRNIPDSYRLGVEAEWRYSPDSRFSLSGNLTRMESYIDEFMTADGTIWTNRTPILSPEWIVNQGIEVYPAPGLTFGVNGTYVSESYLELTNDPQFILPSFLVVDARIGYQIGNVNLRFEVQNLSNQVYFSSGAPVDVDFDGINYEPGYFVNAPLNVFFTTTVRF